MRFYILLLLGLTSWAGCDFEQVKTVKVPEEKLLVLNGTFRPDSMLTVNVSKTAPAVGASYAPAYLLGADVRFYEDGVLLGKATDRGQGFYRLDVYPQAGKTYKVLVNSPDLPQAEAEVKLPALPDIRVNLENFDSLEGYRLTKATLTLMDNKDLKSLYHLRVLSWRKMGFDGRTYAYFYDPPCSSESPYIRNRSIYFNFGNNDLQYICSGLVLLEDDLFNGKEVSLDLTFSYPTQGKDDEIIRTYLMFGEVPPSLKTYLASVSGQLTGDSFFLSEPFNVQGNVKGGLGLVTAFSGIQMELK